MQEREDGSENGQEQNSEGEENQTSQNQGLENPPTDENYIPFKTGPMAGKTLKQIEEITLQQAAVIQEQGRTLNRVNQSRREDEGRQTQIQERKDPDSGEFFQEPAKHTRSIVRQEMEDIVKPFMRNLAETQVETAWDKAEKRNPAFASSGYRQIVEAVLTRSGVTNPTVDDIEHASIYADGLIKRHNIDVGNIGPRLTTQDEGNSQVKNPPPQHRASSQPFKQEAQKKEVRKLDEEERRLARMHNMSDEDWIAMQEADPDKFIDMELPSEQKSRK